MIAQRISGTDVPWVEEAAFDDRDAPRVAADPVEVDDVDEPLDAVTGIAVGVVGGLAVWLVMLFVFSRFF